MLACILRDQTEAASNATITTTVCGKRVLSVMCDSAGIRKESEQECETGGVRMTNDPQNLTDLDMSSSPK